MPAELRPGRDPDPNEQSARAVRPHSDRCRASPSTIRIMLYGGVSFAVLRGSPVEVAAPKGRASGARRSSTAGPRTRVTMRRVRETPQGADLVGTSGSSTFSTPGPTDWERRGVDEIRDFADDFRQRRDACRPRFEHRRRSPRPCGSCQARRVRRWAMRLSKTTTPTAGRKLRGTEASAPDAPRRSPFTSPEINILGSSSIQYGIDDWNDAGWAICVPFGRQHLAASLVPAAAGRAIATRRNAAPYTRETTSGWVRQPDHRTSSFEPDRQRHRADGASISALPATASSSSGARTARSSSPTGRAGSTPPRPMLSLTRAGRSQSTSSTTASRTRVRRCRGQLRERRSGRRGPRLSNRRAGLRPAYPGEGFHATGVGAGPLHRPG